MLHLRYTPPMEYSLPVMSQVMLHLRYTPPMEYSLPVMSQLMLRSHYKSLNVAQLLKRFASFCKIKTNIL